MPCIVGRFFVRDRNVFVGLASATAHDGNRARCIRGGMRGITFGLNPVRFAATAEPEGHRDQNPCRKSTDMRPIGDAAPCAGRGKSAKDLHPEPTAQNDPCGQVKGFEENDEDDDNIHTGLWVKQQIAAQNPCDGP